MNRDAVVGGPGVVGPGVGGPVVVGIDVSPAVSGDTGVARYAEELVAGLAGREDLDVRTTAFGRGGHPSTIAPTRRLGLPLRVLHPLWRSVGRPRVEDLLGPVDVVHAIDGVPPPTRAPLVVTCHDVLPRSHPDLYDSRYRAIAARHVAALASAAAVVTTCHATAAEIERWAGVDPDRVHVASPGRRFTDVPPVVSPSDTDDEPYLLFLGALTPRKGLPLLLRALARMADAPRLVVVGPDGMRAAAVHAALDEVAGTVRVERRGRVGDDELARLVAGATLLCHPSEAEGFGIPVLEAMGLGTPVVAGDIPPVREVGGDAVALVPVDDEAAWAATIERLLGDDDERHRRSARGRELAAPRTWTAMADAVADVYAAVARG